VSQVDTQERLIATYRKKAKHYDKTASGPYKRSGFARVTAWSMSLAAPV
jgi:hypothetical protein